MSNLVGFFPNMKIVPLSYVIKVNPAVIGLIYKLHENDNKKRLYKIYLHGLINKTDAEEITEQLFEEHKMHLNKKFVSFDQIQKLVQKLLDESKENKKSQKLFKESPTDKYKKAAGNKDNIFVKDDTADILQMNMMRRKDMGLPQQSNAQQAPSKASQKYKVQLNEDIDHFDSLSGAEADSPIKDQGKGQLANEDYEFDEDANDLNRNIEGLEDIDAELEYGGLEIENGDDLLDEEEYIAKMQLMSKIAESQQNQGKKGGASGSNKANFLKGMAERDFMGSHQNMKRGNLSD
jgi:Fe-S-cluster formation regulator IscX/YfhJ